MGAQGRIVVIEQSQFEGEEEEEEDGDTETTSDCEEDPATENAEGEAAVRETLAEIEKLGALLGRDEAPAQAAAGSSMVAYSSRTPIRDRQQPETMRIARWNGYFPDPVLLEQPPSPPRSKA